MVSYLDGGAETNTLRETRAPHESLSARHASRPRGSPDDRPGTTLSSRSYCPVGFCRMFHRVRCTRRARQRPRAPLIAVDIPARASRRSATGRTAPWYPCTCPAGSCSRSLDPTRASRRLFRAVVRSTRLWPMRERDSGTASVRCADATSGQHSLRVAFVTRPRWVIDYLADGAPNVSQRELPSSRDAMRT